MKRFSCIPKGGGQLIMREFRAAWECNERGFQFLWEIWRKNGEEKSS